MNFRQKELYAWQLKNFGKETEANLLLGVQEEYGELCHVILKRNQKIRKGAQSDCKDMIADAISDIIIYSLQVLSTRNIDVEKEELLRDITRPAPQNLFRAIAYDVANFYDSPYVWNSLIHYLIYLAETEEIDLPKEYDKVVNEVLSRDWTANRITGNKS